MGKLKELQEQGLLTKPLRHILLEHNKEYQKYIEDMNDGTYKADMLKKTSEMAKNSERLEILTKRTVKAGYVLFYLTAVQLLEFMIAFFQAEFILYFFLLSALAMDWYALYTKKTPFAYVAPVSVAIGLMIDGVLGMFSIMFIWGGIIGVTAIALIPIIHGLNAEYIFLSEQEGFPHFRHILDMEIERNKKALAGEIENYYATMTAPEGKLGDMDEIELPAENITARPDGRNDYMDSI